MDHKATANKTSLLPSKNGEGFTEQLLLEVAEILLSYIKRTYDGEKVLDFHHPHRLLEGLQGFSLDLSDQLELLEQILAHCRETLIYGVKTGNIRLFETLINRFLELAEYLYKELSSRENFGLVFDDEPEHTNVCFWYIPPSLKGRPSGPEWDKLLHQIAPKIKAQMTEEGMTMISYEPQGDKANFFRMVFFNPATGKPDVDFLLEETERLGKDL